MGSFVILVDQFTQLGHLMVVVPPEGVLKDLDVSL
jgi:hypothetical protein